MGGVAEIDELPNGQDSQHDSSTPGVEFRPVRDDAAADLSAWSSCVGKRTFVVDVAVQEFDGSRTRGSGLLGIRLRSKIDIPKVSGVGEIRRSPDVR
jgi:hypothetical protein